MLYELIWHYLAYFSLNIILFYFAKQLFSSAYTFTPRDKELIKSTLKTTTPYYKHYKFMRTRLSRHGKIKPTQVFGALGHSRPVNWRKTCTYVSGWPSKTNKSKNKLELETRI